mmetsp:Transcript_31664/g.73955  ORF Transcript_31664/g.73955 Transcript_31664/m.73955 type:complete len:492 (-) Transcript_31664:46-1521(-)
MGNNSGGPSIPDQDRATYFHEQLVMGWMELLCTPSAMGCVVLNFKPGDRKGGAVHYRVKLRLSHNENVPRYQVHMVQNNRTKEWIVGHLEKMQTHLRTKPGEFMRVQVWKIICNSMVFPKTSDANAKEKTWLGARTRTRPKPSASDMKMITVIICLQAKMKMEFDQELGEEVPVQGSERWSQTISVNDPSFRMVLPKPMGESREEDGTLTQSTVQRSTWISQKSSAGGTPGTYIDGTSKHASRKSLTKGLMRDPDDINVLRILNGSRRVCVAKKQLFSRSMGPISQPFLGVQIKPEEPKESAEVESESEKSSVEALLSVQGLMLLLVCLAWSEETLSPSVDATGKFVESMRLPHSAPGSAKRRGLQTNWRTEDMVKRLEHMPFFKFHQWKENLDADSDDEADGDDDDEGSEMASGDPDPDAEEEDRELDNITEAAQEEDVSPRSAMQKQPSRPKTPVRFVDMEMDIERDLARGAGVGPLDDSGSGGNQIDI